MTFDDRERGRNIRLAEIKSFTVTEPTIKIDRPILSAAAPGQKATRTKGHGHKTTGQKATGQKATRTKNHRTKGHKLPIYASISLLINVI